MSGAARVLPDHRRGDGAMADEFYVTIEGAERGRFAGESLDATTTASDPAGARR